MRYKWGSMGLGTASRSGFREGGTPYTQDFEAGQSGVATHSATLSSFSIGGYVSCPHDVGSKPGSPTRAGEA